MTESEAIRRWLRHMIIAVEDKSDLEWRRAHYIFFSANPDLMRRKDRTTMLETNLLVTDFRNTKIMEKSFG